MANPTTYFGWVMPSSTSLVTNLPADFNTFGQGVDTSFQYLLGGTTGQVLSKTSGTNMAFTWVTPTDQTPLTTKGDLFAFSTVDARLAVGANETRLVADSAQATGLKYVADTTNYAINAKADLLVGTAADTLAALTVGTNGQVLTADSTVSPTGLKWATPSSSSGPAFSAYRITSNQSISAATFTKAQLNAEHFDTDNCFDSTTNYRFTPTTAGKYQINFIGQLTQSTAGRAMYVIYKNGSVYVRGYDNTTSYGGPQSGGSVVMDFNGTTDYAEFYVYSNGTATFDAMSGGAGAIFSGVWIRS